ncbi:hypothetical protein F5Y19DRAFT_454711 [Xylariaceae sp. FL1651]|nr:hypothetical protein F5Y19DRAFT_454711 [Xylariaceae sp. FL1651]
MAGFYPFVYEYGIKDTDLGSSNLCFSRYALLKQQTAHLLPIRDCHTKFIRAIAVIHNFRRR